ncbi:class I SAM-dependent methyltransferase [Thermodesulfobacteriota bacterium]
MLFESRHPEGQAVESAALNVFSRVAAWTGGIAARRVGRILGESLMSGKKVLDIGTGPGTIPLHLARFYPGLSILGLDISFEMLKKASIHREKMELSMPLTAAEGESLPFKDNSIDIVTSLFSLHHMDKPGRLFREVDRVLKPGGALLIIDFRRDMPKGLFILLNALWQGMFYFSAGRKGFYNSVRSAWIPEELEIIIEENDISRFTLRSNPMEIFLLAG